MAPSLVAVAGRRVGLMALTDNEAPFAATDARPGTWYTPIATTDAVLAPIAERIAALRRSGATLVIVSVHWGPNMVLEPPPHQRAFAHALAGLGADLVHGHSAHLVQGVELWRGGTILYDTGDVLDDYAVDLAEGETAQTICSRMQRLSAAFGTVLHPCPDGLSLALR
jgi:poly-gamma-glutamate synthesis protein (capsule biosynthesis protein)